MSATQSRSFLRRFGTYSIGTLTVLVGMIGIPIWLFTAAVVFTFFEGLIEGYSTFGGTLAFLVMTAFIALSGLFASLFLGLKIEWNELRKPASAP